MSTKSQSTRVNVHFNTSEFQKHYTSIMAQLLTC